MKAIKVNVCKISTGRCETKEFPVREVVWLHLDGEIIIESEPGIRIVGGERWGYHVWGSYAYSVLWGRGRYPVVALNEPPSEVRRDENGWVTIAFGSSAPQPWCPISVFVKGVR